jgi:hypothetical protein
VISTFLTFRSVELFFGEWEKINAVVSEPNSRMSFAGTVPSPEIRERFFKSGAAFAGLQWSGKRRGSRKWPQEKFRVN